MKPRLIFQLALVVTTFTATRLPAATCTWDGNTGATGVQDGGGTWNGVNTNWINTTNVAWANGNDAVFGGGTDGSYVISVALNPSATTLAFNNSGYTLTATSAQTITFTSTTSAGGLKVASGKTATIGSNVTVTSATANFSYYITGGGTLVVDNGGTLKGSGTTNTNILYLTGTTIDVKSGGLLSTTTVTGGGTALFVNGTLNVKGGTVDTKLGTLGIGQTDGSPAGTLTITSGEVLANSTNGVRIGSNLGTTPGGTLNLDGGTLSTMKIIKGTGTVTNSIVNFNGGTLKKGVTSNDTFLGGIARANVRDGGAIIDTNGFDATISQALEHSNIGGDAANDGGLKKRGAGTLILSGNNTYNGPTLVEGGVLRATTSNAFGSSSSVTVNGSNQQIQLDGGITINNAFRANGGGLSNTDGAVKNLGGSNTLTDFGFAGTNGTRIHVVADSTLNLPNAFASGNASNLRLMGAGTIVLGGDNSGALASGNLVLLGDGTNAGPIVRAGHNLAFGNATINFQANSASTMQSDTSAARTFNNSMTFGGSTATFGSASTGDLTFGGSVTLAANVDLSIQNNETIFNGAITGGSFGLNKSGAGTLTLNGTGSYTGSTRVTEGTLVVNGNISTSSVQVTGGILGGDGTVGSITLDAGSIAPGNSIGIINADELTWNGGMMAFELSSTGDSSDQLDIVGLFGKGAGSAHVFDFLGTGGSGFTYQLINFGSTNFSVTDFTYTNLASGLTGSFTLDSGTLSFTAVPEPSTLSAGMLLAGGLLLHRRRTRR